MDTEYKELNDLNDLNVGDVLVIERGKWADSIKPSFPRLDVGTVIKILDDSISVFWTGSGGYMTTFNLKLLNGSPIKVRKIDLSVELYKNILLLSE